MAEATRGARSSLPPRAVLVTRPTPYEALLAHHGTREQARFFLAARDQRLDELEARHQEQVTAVASVLAAVPLDWRRAAVTRDDLDRFLFEPEDIVVAVGQDGLVANVAKYLRGQIVVGINPSPSLYDGVLVPYSARLAGELLRLAAAAPADAVRERTMALARTGDGQELRALNEVFVGHRSHQSARYVLGCGEAKERQSSSGLIVTTGTGATGWARSVCRNRVSDVCLPGPDERRLSFFVREAFPSNATGTALTDGDVAAGQVLRVRSEMNEGGVVFGDGIESDAIALHWGMEVEVRVAEEALRVV